MTDQERDQPDEWANLRRDADKGREPDFVSAQLGQRLVSVQALLERIEKAFVDEYANTPALAEADTSTKRVKLLLGTINYLLSVESIQMSNQEKANLIGKAYSNIFGYGPLDALFADENITTISLDGSDKAAVRYGHGDLQNVGPLFQDEAHLRIILRRLLADAGADLFDDQPFIETGLMVGERPVGISITAPPVAFHFIADIRVHPQESPTLQSLVESGFLTEKASLLLQALAESSHGLVIVGDTESGKTTLMGALSQFLPNAENTIAVERAGEIRLKAGIKRLMVRWSTGIEPGMSFGEQIGAALAQKPAYILLDEVRSDEPESIAPLLSDEQAPRQIWSFRGPFDTKRLRNALSMLARRANMSQGEIMISAMYQRLPFVVTLWRARGQIRLYSIGEWQFNNSDYPEYVLLMDTDDGELRLTGKQPMHVLDLPETFWQT